MTFKELKPLIEQWFIDRDLHTKESGRQLIKLEENKHTSIVIVKKSSMQSGILLWY